MSASGLQTLMATAVTDQALCTDLLHGAPAAYAPFDLSADEVASLQTLTASTLEEYARQAHRLFYGEDPVADAPIPVAPHLKQCLVERVGG